MFYKIFDLYTLFSFIFFNNMPTQTVTVISNQWGVINVSDSTQ